MGESYGSFYVPAVSARLHQANKLRKGLPTNLKVRAFHTCSQFFDVKCLGVLFTCIHIHLNECSFLLLTVVRLSSDIRLYSR